MALSADTLAGIREHVGDTPDDATLEAVYARHQSVPRSALEVLRKRLADMIAHPGELTVTGDMSEGWQANMKALESQIRELTAAVIAESEPGVVTVSKLTRSGRSR